ncbi:tight junction protein ZO-1 isoform X4 [Harmonia axyridis]|uniref:tight junction protein ZO-1 isoform X4 n=1 Tax=Harmonia axyridis TaxID=115357 RepID=UPI001E275C2C|nr:tight junction protein ZO-1 isoform X4 [Harmonia axyridis]
MENVANNLANEDRGWEYKQINVTRVPGYGFGIAVSGGRDNPHFASGDPSIAVSDVLASGPAERILQVNDRIISVNGISLQNVDYQTAVQVLRDSGDTVSLVIKRRVPQHNHQHSLSALSASYIGPTPNGFSGLPSKVTLTKNSKKEDFGIVLGCKLFIKEISSKAREQLLNTNQVLTEGDFVTKLNNTNCHDLMSLKEAKKIIDGSKDKIHITVVRDFGQTINSIHQAQSSISTTGAVNNFYKGDDFLTSSQSYSNQNLYVQPPTRNPNINPAGYEDKLEHNNSGPNSLLDDKSNLAPRDRSRGPLTEQNLNHLENRSYGRSKMREEPPRPPPPRNEGMDGVENHFYGGTRRQMYDSDPIIQKIKQPIPDARFITFHKEGSVGIRLTGGNAVGIFVTAVQPGSPASLQGLQPGDKILKVNDMDMTGVTREEAVLFLLSLQDRIELIVQFCKEEYDGIVASQKGDSFYIKTHYHYDDPAKGEMSFRSGDIFHVIDTLYNGVVGCWQVFKIGRNNQEVQKGIIPNKSRAEELATAQFNATKKEMSTNESRGSFFKRRRSSNRRSKSLGKEHWDDILFSDTVSKFPAYERVLLKHPGFTRPVIMFGPIADVAREKLLKDFPDKFVSPQQDTNVEDHKSQKNSSNIIRLSAIREVISTGKHALLDITPNAVERLNYAQMYPIVVFFKSETKLVIKQLRQGLPKSAHKSSKKLLEQCQKLDKVWSYVFSSTITLNDNTDNWYRKVRDVIDKQQSGSLWMSENKFPMEFFDDLCIAITPIPYVYARTSNSLPSYYNKTCRQKRRAPHSMYSSPQFMHSYYYGNSYGYPITSVHRYSQSTLGSCDYQNLPHYPEESLSDDFLFPMSSLRLSYASSPESDLEHSPGPPGNGTGTGGTNTVTPGRLTKASSDPSVVMADNSTTDVLPPYQPSYDSRYGFNNQNHIAEPDTPTSKDPSYSISTQDIPSTIDQSAYNKSGLYSAQPNQEYEKGEYPKQDSRIEYTTERMAELRDEFDENGKIADFNMRNRRQQNAMMSPQMGAYQGKESGDQTPTRTPSKEGLYGHIPDLPPRVDRGAKPMGGSALSSPSKIPNGRSAHERLFGAKSNPTKEGEQVSTDPNFNTKLGSLERSNNSKSDSLSSYDSFNKPTNTRIGPNAHDDLKTTLSKIDHPPGTVPNSTSKYNSPSGQRWDQSPHRYGSKMDLKYGLPIVNDQGLDNSPRTSREMDKDGNPIDMMNLRGANEKDMYRYSRAIAKQPLSPRSHMETKTDYGRYRSSQQDLSQSHLSILSPNHHASPAKAVPPSNGYDPQSRHGGGQQNPTSYKPVPPPKPRNYKPPYNGGNMEGMVQPPPQNSYQHGKSHSNPIERGQSLPPGHSYYYNVSSNSNSNNNSWQGPPAEGMRYSSSHGHYDMAPPYDTRRHPGISYASRSEIQPISAMENSHQLYGEEPPSNRPMDRPIVDLQGSREQRGSAFELYRKPVHHNLRRMEDPSLFGSQPNIAQKLTNSPKVMPKLTKAQSFKQPKSESFGPKLLRKLSFRNRNKEAASKKLSTPTITEDTRIRQDSNRNPNFDRPSKRDISSAMMDHRGGTLINEYWGVVLEVPEGAIARGEKKEIYFVVSDPRLCDNIPPLDLDNGETMLSPLVMCGPQGTEFLKPVILNIPHYANTLPSLGITLKATDSEQDICTDWDNILLPSNHAANSVAVKVDHF